MRAAGPAACPSARGRTCSASSAWKADPAARCLIIGCGCRGAALARELAELGHVIRGTTRDAGRAAELEAAGIEPWVGDPDRIATLARALEHVGVACVLLGSATGTRPQLEALHGTRLRMLMERTIDTTVRGFVYETAGSAPAELLRGGTAIVRAACEDARIPYAMIEADPGDHERWLESAVRAVEAVLGEAGARAT